MQMVLFTWTSLNLGPPSTQSATFETMTKKGSEAQEEHFGAT
jgi:hypothetical protein